MHEYDESIQVCEEGDEEDNDEYEQLVTDRRRVGVSPVRRPPFQTHHQHQQQQQPFQRPSRSFLRSREFNRSESLEMSADEQEVSLDPSPRAQQEIKAGGSGGKKRMSSKEFTPSPQQSLQDGGTGTGAGGGKPDNLISMASSYAKKLMSSGSDKKKERLPPDVASEVSKRSEQKGGGPPPQPQKSRSSEQDEDEEEDEDDYDDDMNMAQVEGLLSRMAVIEPPTPSNSGRRVNPPQQPQPPPGNPPTYSQRRPMFTSAPSFQSQAIQVHPTNTVNAISKSYLRHSFPSDDDDEEGEDDDLSDVEISIAEDELDLARMERIMDTYGEGGRLGMDPQMMMAIPPPNLNNLAMLDEEIMNNLVTHRRLWEYSLDLKREQVAQRTLVMSDILGVHSPGYEVYNPQDYDHLSVPPDIKELFNYIALYEPPMIGTQMDLKLRPFIPEYYPSVGDIDAFIKVLHPEAGDDGLGIKHLDEPAPFQSDPSVLDLRLRSLAKQSSSRSVTVKKIDNVGKNSKIIENWIKDISDLHRSKPSPSVHYSKPMPDIDSLIQEWPPQVEELLKNLSLPSSSLDCDLATYVDIVCNLLDIPVYKSRIQSLHVLFTLYATYKHFNHYGALGGISGEGLLLGSGHELDDQQQHDMGIDRLQINN